MATTIRAPFSDEKQLTSGNVLEIGVHATHFRCIAPKQTGGLYPTFGHSANTAAGG